MSEDSIPISQAIAELEAYRQRIVDSTLEQARKLKLSKKATLAKLEQNPEIIKIDAMIAEYQSRQAAADTTQ
ncbi:MAG: hypothetical protein AAGG51_00105 [Cyanobacteria bacterium P01_G01_bin.54]